MFFERRGRGPQLKGTARWKRRVDPIPACGCDPHIALDALRTTMTTSQVPASSRRLLPLLCAALAALAGCATNEPQNPTTAPRANPAPAPAAVPAATPIAGFAPALRCMDTLLLDYGVRDVTVMVDDLSDATKGAAGAKDMLVSVVAAMTQRSRAIRVIATGKEWGNTVNAMAAAKREQFAVVPQYALRGALSLQDNQTTRRGSENLPSALLGIDLTLLTTQDFSVVPGIASRNSAVLFKQGRAFDGRAEMPKFGITFGLNSSSGAIAADATRALVELASIELFGRLARVPYWTCLGMNEAHAGVTAEIQDWYDSMAVQPAELIKYFQSQLRLRRVYEGPIDGAANAQLKDGVARYREALGLSREAKLSLDFFKAYLAADHVQIATSLAPAPVQVASIAPVPPVSYAPLSPAAPANVTSAPPATARPASGVAPASALSLRIATGQDTRRTPGRAVQLTIRPSRDAHVYCFMQDENRKIMRFFPNRFQRDSRVLPSEGLKLPGVMPFEITLPARGTQETVACFATEQDVLAQLPDSFNAGDFDPLPVASMDQVKSAFFKAANGALAQESLQVQPK
jgi:hypothetical protein